MFGSNKSLWNCIADLPICIELIEYDFLLIMPNHPLGYQVKMPWQGANVMKQFKSLGFFIYLFLFWETTTKLLVCGKNSSQFQDNNKGELSSDQKKK